MRQSEYKIVIGLEVHVHLDTNTKLFCRCRNDFGGQPNTRICPVCTGQPGVLPATNKKAIEQAVKAAIALNCTVQNRSVFARKQYFYPDLPKNYQISQYELPLGIGGYIELDNEKIGITRVHLEEDAGKLIHEQGGASLVDFNRTGTPLLEIVSEPDITSPDEAGSYLRELRKILRYSGVSDCDMEKGSLRCDANLSLNKKGEQLGVKTEVKNMNSFKAVEKALQYEAHRQEKLLKEGERIIQETRLWDEDTQTTRSMRTKEEAHDYRYFPEPDLPVLEVKQEWVEEIRKSIPELPLMKKKRYISDYNLSEYDAYILTKEKEIADYFEEAVSEFKTGNDKKIKKLTNWISVELIGKINAEGIDFEHQPVSAENIAQLVELIVDGVISGKMGKRIFEQIWKTEKSPKEIVDEKGLKQITSEDKIEKICSQAIQDNPDIVKKYKNGKTGVVGALVGGIMKETRGQANPKLVNQKLRELLNKA